jgi:hypothetical protein
MGKRGGAIVEFGYTLSNNQIFAKGMRPLDSDRLCLRDVSLNPAHLRAEPEESDEPEYLLRPRVLRAHQLVAVGENVLRLDVADVDQPLAARKLVVENNIEK